MHTLVCCLIILSPLPITRALRGPQLTGPEACLGNRSRSLAEVNGDVNEQVYRQHSCRTSGIVTLNPSALFGRQLDEFRGVRRVGLYPGIAAVGEDVDGAIGAYPDIADARLQFGK